MSLKGKMLVNLSLPEYRKFLAFIKIQSDEISYMVSKEKEKLNREFYGQ